ncbi:hypothetical protein U9M48_040330 [Paspalum notatum var. saurae]|uniref:Uncharacterized protein n=1 Tax=Paspalum notatum var. saurae TaxID=547442 RepID=A0AAQ3ULI4_PASNO
MSASLCLLRSRSFSFSRLTLSLSSPLSLHLFPGGDDWASSGALRQGESSSGPFTGDENPPVADARLSKA